MSIDKMDELFAKEIPEPVFEFDYLVDDLNMLAKYYIDLYFCDKEIDGKVIPKSLLHSKKYTTCVLNTDICEGIEKIYNAIGIEYTKDQIRYFERQGQLPDDIKYVISVLHDCCRRGIPKVFATGVFIMYLELCEGHKILND